MLFIKLKRDKGPETTIRADHILQMNPFNKDGERVGTWVLVMHTGWFPALHTEEDILAKIAVAQSGRIEEV